MGEVRLPQTPQTPGLTGQEGAKSQRLWLDYAFPTPDFAVLNVLGLERRLSILGCGSRDQTSLAADGRVADLSGSQGTGATTFCLRPRSCPTGHELGQSRCDALVAESTLNGDTRNSVSLAPYEDVIAQVASTTFVDKPCFVTDSRDRVALYSWDRVSLSTDLSGVEELLSLRDGGTRHRNASDNGINRFT